VPWSTLSHANWVPNDPVLTLGLAATPLTIQFLWLREAMRSLIGLGKKGQLRVDQPTTPGCAKLETRPCSTGSLTAAITMGMELVACRRARMTGVVLATIT
jgi:hypothetical protein